MEYLSQHPWREAILATIDSPISEDITESNPRWEFLDSEMIKLGSLEHSLLDIERVQNTALLLLASESKDLRILVHLLRTLQHSGATLEILLALQLLCDYAENFWHAAPPKSPTKKYRLGLQIIKRFENSASSFQQNASRIEKESAYHLFNKLSEYWKNDKLGVELEALSALYKSTEVIKGTSLVTHSLSLSKETNRPVPVTSKPTIELDTSNDRAWKNTLLKVVEYLWEKDIASPISFQLRRYTIWCNITTPPISDDNKTTLSPPSADRIAEYKLAIESPTIKIWMDIEHSLTVSPYWFDGHYLSAQIAKKLGYTDVEFSIKHSLKEFLAKIPPLKSLQFNDETPFLSQLTLRWLEAENKETIISHINLEPLENEPYESYLKRLDMSDSCDTKNKFYDQLNLAKFLEEKGLTNLATQNYLSIYKAIETMTVKEWENSLHSFLHKKLNKTN